MRVSHTAMLAVTIAGLAGSCALFPSLDELTGAGDATAFDPGACGAAGTSSLTHYWPFDEDSGLIARDCVGGFDGMGVGAVGWSVDSHRGGSTNVGTPDASLRFLRMGTTLAESPPFTVTAWVKPASGSALPIVVSHGTDGLSGSVGWELTLANGAPTFVVGIGGGQQATVAGPLVNANTWVFVAAAFDGTTMRVCTAQVCVEKTLDAGTFSPATNHEFRVGTGYRESGTPTLVDELRLYARALTASEIVLVSKR